MKTTIYLVDAFAEGLFSGNPAVVCPLNEWLPDTLMQQIAMENNQAETAFFVPQGEDFHIRWFTPAVEVDLCGHATLASAYVLFQLEGYTGDKMVFHSRSGPLTVVRNGNILTLDFPVDIFSEVNISAEMNKCFDCEPIHVFKGKTDYLFVLGNEMQVRNIQPNYHHISRLDGRGVIITAKGDEVDFVSRFFAPQSGIPEDPATGSAHTTLAPYWSHVLHKNKLTALQLSPRKGYLQCEMNGDRVLISGKAVLYMKGEIML